MPVLVKTDTSTGRPEYSVTSPGGAMAAIPTSDTVGVTETPSAFVIAGRCMGVNIVGLNADQVDGIDADALERISNRAVENGYCELDMIARVPANRFPAQVVQNMTAVVSAVAATSIVPVSHVTRIQGSGGAVTMTAIPNIIAPIDGYDLILIGQSNTNTVKFQSETDLVGSGLLMNLGISFTMGINDTLHLIYDDTIGKWVELSRSNNS